MTRNQIEYVKLLEARRSNLKNEELTSSRDTLAAEAKRIELREAQRHNTATEQLSRRDLDLREGSLDETIRHNQSTEQLQSRQIGETTRHNKAQESETRRHNTETEGAQKISLNETGRHNLVTEAETSQHNRNTENEIHRHNLVSEVSDASRIALDTVTREQQLAETKRHNMAMEVKDFSPKVSVNQNQPTTISNAPSVTGATQLDSGLPANSSVGYEEDPMLRKQPTSDMYGQLYMSRVLRDGKRHLMYAYGIGDQSGFYPVKENSEGRQFITLRNGKRHYLG